MFEDKFPSVSDDANERPTGTISTERATVQPADFVARLRNDETLAALPPPERLAFLRRELDGRIVFTHGFGIEGQLIFHWICERAIDIDVVTLDTGRLFPETYALWAQTERRYGRRIRAIYPHHATLERLVARQGVDGFYQSKRRAKPAATPARRNRSTGRCAARRPGSPDCGPTRILIRHEAGLVGFDASRGLIKFNPLFDWTREAVLARRAPATCRSMPCTPRASLRSAARPARARSSPASPSVTGAGGGRTTTTASAGCICRAGLAPPPPSPRPKMAAGTG